MCAVVESNEPIITNAQSALDLLMDVKYNAGTKNIALAENIVHDVFSFSAPESQAKYYKNASTTAVVLSYTVISRLIQVTR